MRYSILLTGLLCFSVCLYTSAGDKDHPKYGPEGNPLAVSLSRSNDFLRSDANAAPDFWRLMPYYVSQITGGSCSVASVAMIVNGLVRSGRELKDADTNITQSDLLDRITRHPWKKRRGLSLKQLEVVLEESLEIYGVLGAGIQRVGIAQDTPEDLAAFRRILEVNEQSAEDFIVLHYLQDTVTLAPDGPYPHISPVGAYDKKNRKVLILDVDRKWYEPYWVSDSILLKAMSGKTKAFGHGGYIYIRVRPQSLQ